MKATCSPYLQTFVLFGCVFQSFKLCMIFFFPFSTTWDHMVSLPTLLKELWNFGFLPFFFFFFFFVFVNMEPSASKASDDISSESIRQICFQKFMHTPGRFSTKVEWPSKIKVTLRFWTVGVPEICTSMHVLVVHVLVVLAGWEFCLCC